MAQISGFIAAAAQDDRERVAQFAVATRMAMGAEQGDWQLYLNALSGKTPSQQYKGVKTHG
ncbi:hypothetical protein I5U59_15165 [Stenotrophomonas maltophilia]|nr:hypothetical protein [Stenotrophomonas maltophilia]MBH1504411.1 hypothetical protein [Stenotrophomonas maltophilia]MBH1783987.1 hypothetical protein [Stenotrophomonas maltophilia]